MKKHLIIYIIISLLCLNSYAQTIKQSVKTADSLLLNMNYDDAGDLYQRILYFDSLKTYNNQCFYNLFLINKSQNNYQESYNYLNQYIEIEEDNKNLNNAYFEKGQLELLLFRAQNAISTFLLTDSINTKDRRNFYLGVSCFLIEDFNNSEYYFSRIYLPDSLKLQLQSTFNQIHNLENRYNEGNARIFSSIVPGLGQFYYGDINDSYKALLLNAAMISLSCYVAVVYSPLEMLMSTLPWFLRYYQGNINHAVKQCIENKQNHRADLYQELMIIFDKYQVE